MAKPETSGFDPPEHFSRVKMKQAPVRQDSDWNKGGKNRWLRWGIAAVAVGLIAVTGFVIWQQRGPQPVAMLLITSPGDGDTLPLHGTFNVSGEASSPGDIAELQLIVNGQPWGSRTFTVPSPSAQGVWQWTPSAEGTHELVLRAIDASGQVSESAVVHVLASSAADVQFPFEVAAQDGDTFESLAEEYGVDARGLIANHPEYDPNSPLPVGGMVTIPIPIPNADPAGPEGGAPAAPPTGPLPDPQDFAILPIFFADSAPNFILVDGKVVPGQPMDNLYLYVSLDTETPWRRIPEDPLTFLQPQVDGFDISQYLDLAKLESSETLHSLDVEAWGWKGGALVSLGSYHGSIGGGLTSWPPSDTQLQIQTHTVLGIPQYAHEINLVGENPNRSVKFDWSASNPAFFVMWQISTNPFPSAEEISPPGLVKQKLMFGGQDGQFNIDFRQFFDQPASSGFWDDVSNAVNDAVNDVTENLTAEEKPLTTFPDSLPMTFYVRLLAGKPGGGYSPSNTVIVRYLPTSEVLTNLSPSGPIYEAKIIEYIPFRPADPAYKACTVSTKDVSFTQFTGQTTIPAGTQSCGCPGVKCNSGGSDSCGWDPLCYVGKGLEAAGKWFVQAVTDVVNFGVGLYNDAKSYVINTIASFACGWIDDPKAKAACEVGINVAANVAITAFTGIPPDIPNFDKLFDEGLEYAVATVVSEATGIDCDKTCRELLKKGFEAASDPEKLYEEGLDYGVSLAVGELKDLGMDCNAQCQTVIQQGIQGDVDLSNLSPDQIKQKFQGLAHDAAQKLISQNIPCDAQCENAIFEGYLDGAHLGQSVAEAAKSPPPEPPLWVPHELSQIQPGILKIQVFRRFESAQLNEDTIAERCTGFSIDSFATNNDYNTPLDGRLYEPKFVEVPLIEPGGSLVIPVVLDQATWELPAGFDKSQIPAWMAGYTDLGTENGEPIAQVQQQLNLDAWWMWNVLNYGSDVKFSFFGPYMLDVVNGQSMGFPCFAEGSQTFNNPYP